MDISVALATHNGVLHLKEQLVSLLRQSCPPLEIIISDDGSRDGTIELIEKYQREYPSIRLVHSSRAGINANFQKAVSSCNGEYIAFSDQDDIWAENKLELLAEHFYPDTLLVYGKSILIDSAGQQMDLSAEQYIGFHASRSGKLPLFFLFSNCVSGHTMMIRKTLLQEALPFPQQCLYDHWLALVASLKSDLVHVPEAITYHRIHRSNAINNREKNQQKKTGQQRASKYQRYDNQRQEQLLRLEKICDGQSSQDSAEEKEYSMQLLQQIRKADAQFFNFRLFVLLLQKRQRLFHSSWLKECRNRAIGGRYYRFLDLFKGGFFAPGHHS
jgi:glycosyltransferase involved in cell wall biosynthesis